MRKKRGLSQRRLAEFSGITQGYLSEIETGKKKNPSLLVLGKIACALGCKIDDLFDNETPAHSEDKG